MKKLPLIPISLLLVTCASKPGEDDTSFVQSQWTKGIQKLGLALTPVYPPSEDYQVGDIYAVGKWCNEPSDKDQRDKLPRSIKIGTDSSVYSTLLAKYQRRILFPQTSTKDMNGTTIINIGASYTQNTAQETVRTKLTPVPIVAFQEFNIASGSLDKFGGTFASSAFGTIFGASSQKDINLSVKIKQGETYGLDAIEATEALNRFCQSGRCESDNLKHILNNTINNRDEKGFCSAQPMYVQRVYSTRSIDYEYSFTSADAMKTAASVANVAAAGSIQTAKIQQEALSKIIGADTHNANKTTTGPAAVKDEVMSSLISGLGSSLNQLAAAEANGAYFLSGSYNNRSVTLKQVFDRPVVFGYAGLYSGGVPKVGVVNPAPIVLPTVQPTISLQNRAPLQ